MSDYSFLDSNSNYENTYELLRNKISQKYLGKRVKLKQPYKPSDVQFSREKDWIGFEYGIIVEVMSIFHREDKPRNVSLHLFDRQGRIYLLPCKDRPMPTFVDFHISEFDILTDNMSPKKEN